MSDFYDFELINDYGYKNIVLTNNMKKVQKLKKQGYLLVPCVNLPKNIQLLVNEKKRIYKYVK